MTELFNYDTSWLNPALKLVNVGLYIVVLFGYLWARRLYLDDLRKGLAILVWMGVAACVAALLRYFEHGTQFGFTQEFSLKWFQSLGYVAQAILYAAAARLFAKGLIPVIRDK
jgi:hypothetical protein